MDKLEQIIFHNLKAVNGRTGMEYHMRLEAILKDPLNFDLIMPLFDGCEDKNIVLIGSFGRHCIKLIDKHMLTVNGSIILFENVKEQGTGRLKEEVFYPDFISGDIVNKKFTMIDDIYYENKIYDKVTNFLNKYSSQLENTRVIYDDCVNKINGVESEIRFHSSLLAAHAEDYGFVKSNN